ncbi:hypothetical protein P691DRAFT_729053 [Macrolepiota fuliginosa MF-IS2]|uniref:Linalool dehydratase/isomerase domain-containing protein n=1 Tax=Macrolepiota fuliginosa MF-IS2 TaxID=1400762 RepID=A0A9P6C2D7_9AGAR|nr:hypothetical protein P691DRAFT_729053 [Macrolepiota fuliginosa MF-IS2]
MAASIIALVTWLLLFCCGCLVTALDTILVARSTDEIGSTGEHGSYLDTLSSSQRSLFDEAIETLDANFAPPFLFNSPRYSAWYSVGLLARNQGDDVNLAATMIQDVIEFQFKDPTKLWYGTYKNDPNAPDPGPLYPPVIYGSYDPNVGLFVCTSWIIIMEEFSHLLDPGLVTLMKESMYNATVGDGYRVGGVDMDNLFPIYSNPWYMRVMAATYVGNMMGDHNMTMWGDIWAQEAIQEFERFNTLSEFNCGTYAGVTLYALSLWGYMPKSSVIAKAAPGLISNIWDDLGKFWNPSLHTLGGPWDRAYGFDMRKYFAILGSQITGLIRGSNMTEPIPSPLIGSEHLGDVAAAVLTTVISKFHDPHVSSTVRSRLTQRTETPHITTAQAVSPPFDNVAFPRNYSSWNAEGISVGGMEVDGLLVGGAAVNPTTFAPAVLLWMTPAGQVAWLSHHATSSSISAQANAHNLTIAYPPSRAFPDTYSPSNILTLIISGIPGHALDLDFGAEGTAELPGIQLSFSGNLAGRAQRSLVYGAAMLNDLSFYNLTYMIPANLSEIPKLVISFETS